MMLLLPCLEWLDQIQLLTKPLLHLHSWAKKYSKKLYQLAKILPPPPHMENLFNNREIFLVGDHFFYSHYLMFDSGWYCKIKCLSLFGGQRIWKFKTRLSRYVYEYMTTTQTIWLEWKSLNPRKIRKPQEKLKVQCSILDFLADLP